jgi:carbon monoxide dehydrogenase subunit G
MPRIQRSILIHRPVDQVFDFFTDPTNDLKWRPYVREISATGPLHVGATIHQLVRGPALRPVPADIKVTAYEPPTRYAFAVTQGPIRPVGDFEFTPMGSNTQVTVDLSAELRGVKKLLLAKPLQRAMKVEIAGLDRARAVLERT